MGLIENIRSEQKQALKAKNYDELVGQIKAANAMDLANKMVNEAATYGWQKGLDDGFAALVGQQYAQVDPELQAAQEWDKEQYRIQQANKQKQQAVPQTSALGTYNEAQVAADMARDMYNARNKLD